MTCLLDRDRYVLEVDYDWDELCAMEVEAKGYLVARLTVTGGHWGWVTFYDPVRLAQDAADEMLSPEGSFVCVNLIVVAGVTLGCIETALERLSAEGTLSDLALLGS